ncbi:ornithine cyclodeaminase family protein [Corynebacterium incognita]|uniref:Ornithine cyclodeaminase family protein n=1 Tax=Corynebacterium incognita TaxID=2754725 RepID=A0A7G7CN53_9CORY|nr:ornithine cyclodeaminase family protein [Corynebacterium incognita]QNE89019.1 ornithine cyclodeaminase family protein [Corynebacterium incognita]
MAIPFIYADQVHSALSPRAAVETLREVLASGFDPAADQPRSFMPTTHGELLIMPSATSRGFGVKLVSVADAGYEGAAERIQGTYVLFDDATLAPSCLIDGIALTSLRTPAVSLAGVVGFLRDDAAPLKVAIVGTGAQGRAHETTVESVFEDIREVDVMFLGRTKPADLENWASLSSAEGKETLAAAELVICATTASEPYLGLEDVRSDAVIVALGSHTPDAREVRGDLMAGAQVIVEDVATAQREAGDVIQAVDEGALEMAECVSLADVVRGTATVNRERPIVFKFTGMPWEDLALAQAVADIVEV